MTNDESRLLADLRAMWQRADPVPAELADEMIAAVAGARLDEELEILVLVSDSATRPEAQVRGSATARVLYFQAEQGWSLDAEISDDQVSGQMLDFEGDMGSVEVVVETPQGATWATRVDEVGFFTVQVELTDAVRFTVRHRGPGSVTAWVKL
jgi:hypothetical protein